MAASDPGVSPHLPVFKKKRERERKREGDEMGFHTRSPSHVGRSFSHAAPHLSPRRLWPRPRPQSPPGHGDLGPRLPGVSTPPSQERPRRPPEFQPRARRSAIAGRATWRTRSTSPKTERTGPVARAPRACGPPRSLTMAAVRRPCRDSTTAYFKTD